MSGLHSKKITCDGSAHTLASQIGNVQSKWFQFLADASNSAAALIGGSDVETNGFPLVAGAAQMPPVNGAEMFNFYDAGKIYYDGADSDIIYVLWVVG